MSDFTGKVIGERVLKPDDSLANLVQTTIFTVLTQNFKKFFSYFVAFHFFKKQEKSVFGTQLVPNTSELNRTGSTNYTSTVMVYLTNFALFPFQKISISQKLRFVGASKYCYFDPKNQYAYCVFH